MFTQITPENRFTNEEIDELHRLMSLPENQLLSRFITSLWKDRSAVISAALQCQDQYELLRKAKKK